MGVSPALKRRKTIADVLPRQEVRRRGRVTHKSAYNAKKRASSGHLADIYEITTDDDPPLVLRLQNGDQLMKRPVDSLIVTVRGRKVLLDADLAAIYRVTTKRLNEQVKRNKRRFPSDFLFQLTSSEKKEVVANCDHLAKLKFYKAPPYAFTEHS
jgi:hypothetical protein